MKIIKIRKRSGGTRTIYACTQSERDEYRSILYSSLSHIRPAHAHGFVNDRNIVTNAVKHCKKNISISLDLSDFFDSCTAGKAGKLPQLVQDKCFIDGAARQGLPTSPAISNFMAQDMDSAIVKMLRKIDTTAVYTRYADDITISTDSNDYAHIYMLVQKVNEIIRRNGFKLNTRKTRIQNTRSGKREVCGVMVDNEVSISRHHRRKLRGMRYRLKFENDGKKKARLIQKIRGLEEFSQLKIPKIKNTEEQKIWQEAEKIYKEYRLSKVRKIKKIIEDQNLGQGVYITNDPSYFLGMSAYTTGWTSCADIVAKKQYHKGVVFWANHPGVSLAYLKSEKKKNIAGVERNVMIARTLIFQLKNGEKTFARVYGNEIDKLKKVLQENGILQGRKGEVRGYVRKTALPYMDAGTIVSGIKLKERKGKWCKVQL